MRRNKLAPYLWGFGSSVLTAGAAGLDRIERMVAVGPDGKATGLLAAIMAHRPWVEIALIAGAILCNVMVVVSGRPSRHAVEQVLWSFWKHQLGGVGETRVSIMLVGHRWRDWKQRAQHVYEEIRDGNRKETAELCVRMRAPDSQRSGTRFGVGEGICGLAWDNRRTFHFVMPDAEADEKYEFSRLKPAQV